MGGKEGFTGANPQHTEGVVSPIGTCDAYVDECQDFQFESDTADTYGGVPGDRLTKAEEEVRRNCTFVEGCWLKNNCFSSVFAEMKSQESLNA